MKLSNTLKEYYQGQAKGLLEEIMQSEQDKSYISEKLKKLGGLLNE